MNKNRMKNQGGFTLFLSLVFLIILTIVGLTSVQSTRTELAMSGNLRESDISFQAAEMGLNKADNFIENNTSTTTYNDSNGLFSNTADDPDYYDDATWKTVQVATSSMSTVHAQPKYIIKYLGDRSQNEVAAVNITGYGSEQPGLTVSNFRITTRGYGQSDNVMTMLQSYYGRIINAGQ